MSVRFVGCALKYFIIGRIPIPPFSSEKLQPSVWVFMMIASFVSPVPLRIAWKDSVFALSSILPTRRNVADFCFSPQQGLFAVCFVHPKHRYAEISQNKVENLSFDHRVGHIFPDADHTFHTRQFRRPEREQRFDERRADGAAVTLFDFKVFGHGRALVECDFTADFERF